MYAIVIRYDDDSRTTLDDHIDDLGEACAYVLKLADQLGNAAADGAALPKWVEIHRDERLEISVSIVRGGLLRQTDG